MKAWILRGADNICYEETEKPRPAAGEVLVRVMASGICGSDIPRIYRDGAHKMPLIPGHEFSGEVVELGSQADEKWLGKRVGIYPLIPCGVCAVCKSGRYEMCRQYSYLGSRRDGGFAEYAAVPQDNLMKLPDTVSYEQAAMLEPLAVAVHAMRRIPAAPEDTVTVCGLGTIGMLLTMLLMERGTENLLLIGNKEYQRRKALELGIPSENCCDCENEDAAEWMRRRTGGKGTDVFFECVGRNQTVSWAVDMAAPGGRICLTGNPDTDMALEKAGYWKILRNQIQITGTWNSSFFRNPAEDVTDWEYALGLLERKRIVPERLISHRLPLEGLDGGLRIMKNKSEDHLKIMTV